MHACGRTAILVGTCCFGLAAPAWSQTPAAVESLRRSLSATAARIDSLEAGLCPGPSPAGFRSPPATPRTDSLAATLDRLNRRVEAMRATRCPAGAPAQPADTTDDLAALRAAAAAAAGQAAPSDSADTSGAVPQADSTRPRRPPSRQPAQSRDQRHRRRATGRGRGRAGPQRRGP